MALKNKKPNLQVLHFVLENPPVPPETTSFHNFYQSLVWLPEENGTQKNSPTMLCRAPFNYMVFETDNYWFSNPSGLDSWDQAIQAGCNYMAGECIPVSQFVELFTVPLTGWQRVAHVWCMANPKLQLELIDRSASPQEYIVGRRGEYVEFILSRRRFNKDKRWISKTGRTKVLVDVD